MDPLWRREAVRGGRAAHIADYIDTDFAGKSRRVLVLGVVCSSGGRGPLANLAIVTRTRLAHALDFFGQMSGIPQTNALVLHTNAQNS